MRVQVTTNVHILFHGVSNTRMGATHSYEVRATRFAICRLMELLTVLRELQKMHFY